MWYLITSILCSISVGILFRLVKLKLDHLIWTLFFTYITCFALTNVLLNVTYSLSNISSNSWILIVLLSFLLPSVFIALKKSIVTNGIAKTDVIQRLSLFIPILASFLIFKEDISNKKIIALIIGLSSIYFILSKNSNSNKKSSKNFFYLLSIFLGYGLIDILFKSITKLPFYSILAFTFIGATAVSLFYIIIKRIKFNSKSIVIGLILGFLNFFNIFTYLEAHKYFNESPTIVFTGMNLGVICLGVLIGKLFFKEKITIKNIFGICLAIISVIILYTSVINV